MILFWVISAFGVKRDIKGGAWWRSAWVRVGVLLFVAGALADASALRHFTFHFGVLERFGASGAFAYFGALLVVLGISLAIWARVYLGRNWSPAPALKENHELVTTGPYEMIRHPIYTGILLAMLGSGIVTAPWFVTFFVGSVIFAWRVQKEEALMMKEFPDQYPVYKKKTWALVPFIY